MTSRGVAMLILKKGLISNTITKSKSLSFWVVYKNARKTKSICLGIVILHGQQHETHMVTQKKLQEAATSWEAAISM